MTDQNDILEARVALLEELVRVLPAHQNTVMQQLSGKTEYVISERLVEIASAKFHERIEAKIEADPYLRDRIAELLRETGLNPPPSESHDS